MTSEPPSSPGSSESTTDRLAAGAAAADRQAFARLYERVAPAIYTFACARLRWRWIDAEDVVAEVWVRGLHKLGEYDPARSFRRWIFGIASRVVKEFQRRLIRSGEKADGSAGREALSQLPLDATGVSQRVARDQDIREFAVWVRGLSDYEREVLILRGLEGRPHREVAAVLDRSLSGVKECWSQIVKKLEGRAVARDLFSS